MAKTWRDWPAETHPYFLYAPNGDGMQFYATREERDAAAEADLTAEREHAREGWSDDVRLICVGEVTARATKVNVRQKPEREDFEDGEAGDEQYEDAMSEWPDECFDTTCDYELKPTASAGSET